MEVVEEEEEESEGRKIKHSSPDTSWARKLHEIGRFYGATFGGRFQRRPNVIQRPSFRPRFLFFNQSICACKYVPLFPSSFVSSISFIYLSLFLNPYIFFSLLFLIFLSFLFFFIHLFICVSITLFPLPSFHLWADFISLFSFISVSMIFFPLFLSIASFLFIYLSFCL